MAITINSPLPSSLASECRKAAKILNSFTDNGKGVDIIIPSHILRDAKGLAIFTVLKAGFLFSGRAGSGLVVARLPDGSWSAPSAIMTGGMGFGGQVGAELTDFIMVLNTTAAVKTFMHHGSITLGGNISVAAGPVGRNAEASGTASIKSLAAVYSYSKTRGLFAGISLEGSVILERHLANKKMYGRKVSAKDLLNGTIPPPPSADSLYRALEIKSGGAYTNNSRFSYMDSQYDSGNQRYDHSPTRASYDNSMSQHRGLYEESPSSRPMSFSRANVRSLAKGGAGFESSTSYTSSTIRDNSNTLDYQAPKQIAATPYLDDSRALVTTTSQDSRARALFNFPGQQDGDLVFHKGDIITIVKKSNTQNDWWTGKIGSRQGIFPANFVEPI
ncbi:hypothetical protein A0J61_01753 [Choanephora cucurbitarum]|uniref:SH3 domain-containing protein n=1 Tax=Choanephora cucurbitarum TaxID=101091 RepID=A0A1C7NM75_9FUNG|nr:hypothetical protein A0J61_01753 [Choanephora cucurbitarum]